MKRAMADVGSKLKQVRQYLNLSQQVVSDKTGIPRTAISAMESGKRKIDSIELAKLAKLYDYPVSYFLEEQATPEDETFSRLYRAAGGLDENDRQELIRFAEYLRFSGARKRKGREDRG